MIRPTLEEVQAIATDESLHLVPISMEMYSDEVTPTVVLKKLKKASSNCFILESVEDTKKWGRYTFLGFEPRMEVSCLNGVTTVRRNGWERAARPHADADHAREPGQERGNDTFTYRGNPNDCIRKIMECHKGATFDYLPPFTGGLVGYFAYDYVKYTEPVLALDAAADPEQFNDVDLMLFDKVIAFDNFRQKIVLIVNLRTSQEGEAFLHGLDGRSEDGAAPSHVKPSRGQADGPLDEAALAEAYEEAIRQLAYMKDLIQSGEPFKTSPARLQSEFKSLFSEDEYVEMVNRAKDYIREGDIFQVVLSNRFEADFEGSLFDAYRILRTLNPSPYMFYFSSNHLEIAGASPETLVKLQDGQLHTFPLAGTRPRGGTGEEDAALEQELLADEKELAEHNMLVDLGRNDLGKISQFGSVKVETYMEVLRFSHVMHIGSTVSGTTLPDKTGLDAVNAVLPAGTLSGAPKIRAMQIINELEQNKRGIYGGAIGYLDFAGNMDTCIAIRIAYKKNGKVFIRSGAGVVADSNPQSEYRECVNKLRAVWNALQESEGGLD